ncbi:hypothetical protein AEM51_11020 [Bacteroidetes bacterium UKL13-3]|nr:hypothetical protein AEM51_11020 [Bacteroidetes bacterium UKL13-3]HCP93283.1 hypothetical protein [Bacteroidota bacterium]
MLKKRIIIVGVLLITLSVSAQIGYKQKSTNVGRIGLTMSTVGTIGRPTLRSNVQGDPSMSYPQKGLEHLFESGFWIGALVNGQKLVSSSAFDASSGYSTGAPGYEFTATANPIERSKLTSSPNYSSSAISHQDFVFRLTDSNTVVPGTSQPISSHDNPLKASVKLESYAWNLPYADYFVICNYEITNNSTNTWDSIWMGQWADLVVRNVNVSRDAGTAFFSRGRNGIDTKYKAIYAWMGDNTADDANYIQSYGAMQFLGMDWRGMFFNPNKPDTFLSRGFSAPKVNYNFWNFTSVYPEFTKPADDLGRYDKLAIGNDSLQIYGSNGPFNGSPANWIQLISAGPLPSVAPGEKFNYVVAYVAAKKSVKQIAGNTILSTPESRAELTEHFARTRSTFVGEDVNEDGNYSPELDANGNGILDRFVLPEPPTSPKMKIVPSDNKVEIYWDASAIESVDPITRVKDFEGFRLYRSNAGDDLDQNLADNSNLITQWDSVGNDIGFNNGFDAIKLAQPVKFDGDPVTYNFRYTMDNLLNGWQYQFTITAFDKGNKLLNIGSLESSFTENEMRAFAGTSTKAITENGKSNIGVYPNPYRTTAAWDGGTSRTNKIYFTNLPAKCEITIYTSNGDLVANLNHNAETYQGEDAKWFEVYGNKDKMVFSGGEHAWDLLSNSKTTISMGVYLFTVKDTQTGNVEVGKFAVMK